MKSERGFSLIEILIAVAILGLVAVTFLSGLATVIKGTVISNEQAIAESLVRVEAEYVKGCDYKPYPSVYPVNPELKLTIPSGWNIPQPTVGLVHATDDGIQKVTITAEHDGEAILSIEIYKVDR
ncbi:hypothetical protein ES705_03328 [subsurface metagenome]